MRDSGIELAVGETLQMGDHLLTIVDIHDDEITLRIDRMCDIADFQTAAGDHPANRRAPR